MEFVKNDECKVVILTGGGGVGVTDVKYSSEKNMNKKIKNFLEKLCKEKSWILTEKH